MSRRPARNQSLPEDQVEIILRLRGFELYRHLWRLYDAGWTLRSLGEVFDPPKTRSTVRSWVDRGRELVAPESPLQPVVRPDYVTPPAYIPARPPSPGISPTDAARLKALAPVARRYRAGMHPNHTAAKANQELTDLCKRVHTSGVPVSEIAATMGVTYRAVFKRVNHE